MKPQRPPTFSDDSVTFTLTGSGIDRLRQLISNDNDDKPEMEPCCICLEEPTAYNNLGTACHQCSFIAHLFCMHRHLDSSNKCPMCGQLFIPLQSSRVTLTGWKLSKKLHYWQQTQLVEINRFAYYHLLDRYISSMRRDMRIELLDASRYFYRELLNGGLQGSLTEEQCRHLATEIGTKIKECEESRRRKGLPLTSLD